MIQRASLLLVVGVSTVLAACGGSGPDLEGLKIARLGAGTEPKSLDPHAVTGHGEHRILTSLFEGVVNLNQTSLEIEPGVAERWDVSEDGLTYTFHLNPEAKWSNGEPVTAHDFVYGWRRHLEPNLASEYSYMLWVLENAEAYNKGAIEDFEEVGAKALDDHTLQARLAYPAPYFISAQIHYAWFPVHQGTIEAFGAIDSRGTPWIRAGNMVSNGPFYLETWEPGRIIRVLKSEHYWDAEAIALDGIEFYPIDSLTTEEREFRAGTLDMTYAIPVNKIPSYREENPEVLHIDPFIGTYFYRFNCEQEPLDDPRVRMALGLAIDRESIANDVLHETVSATGVFTPPGLVAYTAGKVAAGVEAPALAYGAAEAHEFDPEKARALLAEAGFPNGEGFPAIEILYNTSEDHKRIAEAIQAMWREHLNVDIGASNQDWKVYLTTMTNINYDIARSAWIADYLDPINYLECFTAGNGNNRTGWSNEAFDALIEEARRTADWEERIRIYDKAESILLAEAPITPIYSYTQRFLRYPHLLGAESNILGYMNYKYMDIDMTAAEAVR